MLLSALILSVVVAAVVVVVAVVVFSDIIDWFQLKKDIKESDKDNMAFTINEKLANGEYKVVQGIFNKRTNECDTNRVLQAKKLDPKFAKYHSSDDLVIYE